MSKRRIAKLAEPAMARAAASASGEQGSQLTKLEQTLNLEQMGVEKLDVLRSEVDAMRRLDHPNIVKLYETFEEGQEIHMVMELCTGGVLIDRLEQSNRRFLDEPEVARLVAKLLSALVHCHERDVLQVCVALPPWTLCLPASLPP